jgi:hypothetical protein
MALRKRRSRRCWLSLRRLAPETGLHCSGCDHADGVPCSANVPRPAASSFISLRKAPHRRDRSAQRLIGPHNDCVHVQMASGAPRSEIKEEAAGRGTFAEGSTRCHSHSPRTRTHKHNKRWNNRMKKLWFALLFLAGGITHEIRNPVSCQCITARFSPTPRPSMKKRSPRCVPS